MWSTRRSAISTSRALPGISSPGPTSRMQSNIRAEIESACPIDEYRGKKVLLIVPDNTRTAPMGLMFRAIHQQIGSSAKALDVLIALGTHQPLSEAAIRQRLEISEDERNGEFQKVRFFNHE